MKLMQLLRFLKKEVSKKQQLLVPDLFFLQQAKLDGIKVFVLLDTLKGFDEVKLSAVVAEVLNYNRLSTSVLGFKNTTSANTLEKRNIAV